MKLLYLLPIGFVLGIGFAIVIEKIAKAIEENLNGSSYKSLAEAVLNYLLGVEK